MAKFKINWLEKKSPDWAVATLLNEDGIETKDVSINKTSKKGDIFPNFDTLAPGMDIEGEPWASTSGKVYLFPPKPKLEPPTDPMFQKKKPNMERIMEKKDTLIAQSQERKSKSIEEAQDRSAWMWAKTNASTLIANSNLYKDYPADKLFIVIEELATQIYNSEPLVPFN